MNQEIQNCYFYVDNTLPEEEQKISVMCLKCHDEKYPKVGWFWNAQEKGYGPFKYICSKCQNTIYQSPSYKDEK